MNIIETLRVALTALTTNRLRALLTTLGIMIGVASVVSLMSLGGSLQNYIQSQFEDLGADVLQISSSRFRNTSSGTQPLTTQDANGLTDPAVVPHVEAVSWTYSVQTSVRYGENSSNLSVQGVTANYAEVNDWHPTSGGAFITQNDIDASARVALIELDHCGRLFRYRQSSRSNAAHRRSGVHCHRCDGRTFDYRTVQPNRACPDYNRPNTAGKCPCRW